MREGSDTSAVQENEIGGLDIALILAESWRLLLYLPLTTGFVVLALSFLITPTYTATTRILPPAQQQSMSAALGAQFGTLAALVGGTAGLKHPADQYVALLKSRSVFDAVVHRFGLKELYNVPYVQDARNALEQRTRIYASKDGLIFIEVDDHEPTKAAAIANAFIEELRNLTKTLAITEAAQRRLFFEEQLAQAKNNLAKAEIALQASGVSEATLRTVPQSAMEALARLKAQITAQEIKLASMRTFMTDANPEFRVGVQELAALRTELAKAEQRTPIKAVANGAEYITKFRDFKYYETLFELMAKQYELARLDEARDGAVIQIVDRALPPERKSSPKKGILAVVATLAMFVIVLLFVLLRRGMQNLALDPNSAQKLNDIRRMLRLRRS